MIPRKLTMKAFGPFSREQTVDFTALSSENLFMICGPTGSGKTTVFDALVFALYGEPSGDLRHSDQLKSDYAGTETECSVTFSFLSEGEEYTVVRRPKQPYVNRNGVLADRPESVRLILPDKTELSGTREANEKLRDILRLTREQFRKIVMLPQGEFRKMLNADSGEKQEIFRKLFSTELYNVFTERLREKSGEIRQEYRENEIACRSTLQSSSEVFEGTGFDDADFEGSLALAERIRGEKKSEFDALRKTMESTREKADAINLELMAETNGKFDRLSAAQNALTRLERSENEFGQKRSQLDRIRRTQQIKGLYDRLGELQKAFADETEEGLRLKAEEKKAVSEEERAAGALEKAEGSLSDLPELIKQADFYRGQLEIAAELREKEKELSEREADAKRFQAENDLLSVWRSCLLKKEARGELEAKEDGLILFENAVKDYRSASEAFARKKADYMSGLSAYLDSQAFYLAQNLKEGVPCPVCGSTEHPSPACAKQTAISSERVEELKTLQEKAQERCNAAFQSASSAFSSCAELFEPHVTAKTCLEEADDAHLLRAKREIGERIDRLTAEIAAETEQVETKKGALKLSPDLDETQRQTEQRHTLLLKAETEASLLADERDALRKSLQTDLTADELSENKTMAEAKAVELRNNAQEAKLARERAALRLQHARKDIQDNDRRLAAASSRLEELNAEWESAFAADSGLTKDEFTACLPLLDGADHLAEEIEAYQTELLRSRTTVAELAKELAGKERFPLEEMKAKKDALLQDVEQANAKLRALGSDLDALSRAIGRLGVLLKRRSELEEIFRDVDDLYQISRGNNAQRLDLERYVLSSYFDEVVDRANLRLDRMTNSRYTLIRRTEREKGNRPSGLDLDVFDAYTGKSRHINTLSGGESFQCALCLALGLSDAIAENAGGIRIDTLFIDEGFGSLDTQSLDAAVECIQSLRDSGRLVGIISHVETLRERIPVRLQIVPGPTGSTIRTDLPQ